MKLWVENNPLTQSVVEPLHIKGLEITSNGKALEEDTHKLYTDALNGFSIAWAVVKQFQSKFNNNENTDKLNIHKAMSMILIKVSSEYYKEVSVIDTNELIKPNLDISNPMKMMEDLTRQLSSLIQNCENVVELNHKVDIFFMSLLKYVDEISVDNTFYINHDKSYSTGLCNINEQFQITLSSHTGISIVERPDTRFHDVIGADDTIHDIKAQTLMSWENPELAEMYEQQANNNILIYGPPGTGKTLLVKAIAGELDIPLYSLQLNDILSKWIGEAEQAISDVFTAARSHEKAILFIDEIDALSGKRSGNSANDNVVTQFLTELEGASTSSENSLLFIGACNNPWNMDNAILRRMNPKYYLGMPDHLSRSKLFTLFTKNLPIADDFDADNLATLSKGYSGSDIQHVVRSAARQGFKNSIELGKPETLNQTYFIDAFTLIKRSVTDELLDTYQQYQDNI